MFINYIMEIYLFWNTPINVVCLTDSSCKFVWGNEALTTRILHLWFSEQIAMDLYDLNYQFVIRGNMEF